MSEIKKNIFGITNETKDSNVAPIFVPKKVTNNPLFPAGWQFPIGNLVNVISNPAFEKKDGSTSAILQFVFRDKEKRQHTHFEWELESDDAKFQDKLEYMNIRIKHIYTSIFGEFPKEGIGGNASSFAEFFNMVADAFNNKTVGEGESVRKLYPTVDLFIKLTYYKKNLGFPLSPNFLEKVVKNQPCKLLTVDTRYDKLEPSTGGTSSMPGMPGMPGMDMGSDLPAFDSGFGQ